MNRNIISIKKENNINKKIKILRKILNSNKRFRKRGGMCASGGAQSESENPIPKTKGLVFDWKDNSLHYQKPPLPRVNIKNKVLKRENIIKGNYYIYSDTYKKILKLVKAIDSYSICEIIINIIDKNNINISESENIIQDFSIRNLFYLENNISYIEKRIKFAINHDADEKNRVIHERKYAKIVSIPHYLQNETTINGVSSPDLKIPYQFGIRYYGKKNKDGSRVGYEPSWMNMPVDVSIFDRNLRERVYYIEKTNLKKNIKNKTKKEKREIRKSISKLRDQDNINKNYNSTDTDDIDFDKGWHGRDRANERLITSNDIQSALKYGYIKRDPKKKDGSYGKYMKKGSPKLELGYIDAPDEWLYWAIVGEDDKTITNVRYNSEYKGIKHPTKISIGEYFPYDAPPKLLDKKYNKDSSGEYIITPLDDELSVNTELSIPHSVLSNRASSPSLSSPVSSRTSSPHPSLGSPIKKGISYSDATKLESSIEESNMEYGFEERKNEDSYESDLAATLEASKITSGNEELDKLLENLNLTHLAQILKESGINSDNLLNIDIDTLKALGIKNEDAERLVMWADMDHTDRDKSHVDALDTTFDKKNPSNLQTLQQQQPIDPSLRIAPDAASMQNAQLSRANRSGFRVLAPPPPPTHVSWVNQYGLHQYPPHILYPMYPPTILAPIPPPPILTPIHHTPPTNTPPTNTPPTNTPPTDTRNARRKKYWTKYTGPPEPRGGSLINGGGAASSIPVDASPSVRQAPVSESRGPSDWNEVIKDINARAERLGVDYERASNVAQLRWPESNRGGPRGCKNTEDPVTFEKFERSDFEELNLRKLPSGYCYKVDTLLQLDKWEDPLTRDKLPEKWDVIDEPSPQIEESVPQIEESPPVRTARRRRHRNAFMHAGSDNIESRSLRDITNVTQNDEYVLQTPKKRTSYWSSIGVESPKIKSSNVGADVIGGLGYLDKTPIYDFVKETLEEGEIPVILFFEDLSSKENVDMHGRSMSKIFLFSRLNIQKQFADGIVYPCYQANGENKVCEPGKRIPNTIDSICPNDKYDPLPRDIKPGHDNVNNLIAYFSFGNLIAKRVLVDFEKFRRLLLEAKTTPISIAVRKPCGFIFDVKHIEQTGTFYEIIFENTFEPKCFEEGDFVTFKNDSRNSSNITDYLENNKFEVTEVYEKKIKILAPTMSNERNIDFKGKCINLSKYVSRSVPAIAKLPWNSLETGALHCNMLRDGAIDREIIWDIDTIECEFTKEEENELLEKYEIFNNPPPIPSPPPPTFSPPTSSSTNNSQLSSNSNFATIDDNDTTLYGSPLRMPIPRRLYDEFGTPEHLRPRPPNSVPEDRPPSRPGREYRISEENEGVYEDDDVPPDPPSLRGGQKKKSRKKISFKKYKGRTKKNI
uniref:SAM domain-containing protein n=1 Tax=viral metagenome TaxID=1070528 RepID=A0A6C0AH74_9ZZZZ